MKLNFFNKGKDKQNTETQITQPILLKEEVRQLTPEEKKEQIKSTIDSLSSIYKVDVKKDSDNVSEVIVYAKPIDGKSINEPINFADINPLEKQGFHISGAEHISEASRVYYQRIFLRAEGAGDNQKLFVAVLKAASNNGELKSITLTPE